jgi:hypothetical protein
VIDAKDLTHPYVFFAYMRLTTSTPYPVGTLFVSLRDEMDDDDGRERITTAGNVWKVITVNGDDRYIACEATGASIVPTVAELLTQFTLTHGGAPENSHNRTNEPGR